MCNSRPHAKQRKEGRRTFWDKGKSGESTTKAHSHIPGKKKRMRRQARLTSKGWVPRQPTNQQTNKKRRNKRLLSVHCNSKQQSGPPPPPPCDMGRVPARRSPFFTHTDLQTLGTSAPIIILDVYERIVALVCLAEAFSILWNCVSAFFEILVFAQKRESGKNGLQISIGLTTVRIGRHKAPLPFLGSSQQSVHSRAKPRTLWVEKLP